MEPKRHDLVILGAGPAGYVAAIRAAQLGFDAACVEQHPQLGGTCLRVGCIPSKALLESSHKLAELAAGLGEHGIQIAEARLDLPAMMRRKDDVVRTLCGGIDRLFRQHGVTRYLGRGRIDGPGRVVVEHEEEATVLEAPRVMIATGSKPASLGVAPADGQRVGTSSDALAYPEVPSRLVVIGAGYIGLELGSVWNRLGSEVIVLEALDRALPGTDAELAAAAMRILEKQGIQFRLGCRVEQARTENGHAVVECEGQAPISCDRVLVAVGRVPRTADLGLASAGVPLDPRGEIPVDDDFQTPVPGIYAVGDCIRGARLAHKASHEAIACVERFAGQASHVDYDAIPSVIFTHPEIAAVGRTEEQLGAEGREYRCGKFPFRASGRARTLGDTDGVVKMLADATTDRVLGVHVLGPRAGDVIAEAAAAMQFGASAEDLARVCHAHPTLAESLGEAALDVAVRAVHIPPRRRAPRQS